MATIKQAYVKDLSVWRPVIRKSLDSDLWSSVTQISGKSLVSIPATSKAVNRTNANAAYLRFPFYFDPTVDNQEPPPPLQISRIYQTATGPRIAEIYRPVIVTSGGNPSTPPTLSVGDILLSEGSVDNGSVSVTNVTAIPVSANNPHVGAFSAAYVGREVNNSKNLWIIPGNEGIGVFSPKAGIETISVVRNPDDTLDFTCNHHLIGPDNLFPVCCVIESELWLDRLLYTGGLADISTRDDGAYIFSMDGTVVNLETCPVPLVKAAVVCLPGSECILLTGGINLALTESTNTTLAFNPYGATSVWDQTVPSMITPRRDHQMVVIDSGGVKKVLVVGGRNGLMLVPAAIGPEAAPTGEAINKCETIEIPTDRGVVPTAPFIATGSMSDGRAAFGMTKLPDGRVLVVGGIGNNPNYPIQTTDFEVHHELSSCEIYDPESGQWTPIASTREPHSYCTCTYMASTNRVYVMGGYTSRLVEYLDLATMTWHVSKYTMPVACTLGTPINLGFDFCGVIGGGTYDVDTDTLDLNDDLVEGSSWNSARIDVPEYTRYDDLNAEWKVVEHDELLDIYRLEGRPMGDHSNTDVRWSDRAIDHGQQVRFTLAKAVASSAIDLVGPFIVDTVQPFTLGGVNLVLAQSLYQGKEYDSVSVSSGGLAVTGESWLVFDYGYETQCGPVRCYGSLDDTTLMIDAGFKFPANLAPGAQINILYQKAAQSVSSNSFWLTASNAGRAATIDYITEISAAGILLEITTRYPGDRGLGNEGHLTKAASKLSDIVEVFGRDDVDIELEDARGG